MNDKVRNFMKTAELYNIITVLQVETKYQREKVRQLREGNELSFEESLKNLSQRQQDGGFVKWFKTPALHAGMRRFDSCIPYHSEPMSSWLSFTGK